MNSLKVSSECTTSCCKMQNTISRKR